jgi:hypothetical protein
MPPKDVGFGVEAEMSVRNKPGVQWVAQQPPQHLAMRLTNDYHVPARAATNNVKYPPDYKKWWITHDGSIQVIANTGESTNFCSNPIKLLIFFI